jgi:hypothetical protein
MACLLYEAFILPFYDTGRRDAVTFVLHEKPDLASLIFNSKHKTFNQH